MYGWATEFDPKRSLALGFEADINATEIIETFIEDEFGGTFVS